MGKNSKKPRNNSKKRPRGERSLKKPRSLSSKRKTTCLSKLKPIKTLWPTLKTDAISSFETRSNSKVKSRSSKNDLKTKKSSPTNLSVKNESSKTKSPNSKKISM